MSATPNQGGAATPSKDKPISDTGPAPGTPQAKASSSPTPGAAPTQPSSDASATSTSPHHVRKTKRIKKELSGGSSNDNDASVVTSPAASAATASAAVPAPPIVPFTREEKRNKFITELIITEEAHVEALKTVIVDYLQPLRQILTKDKLKKLFGNIELILGWNMQFLGRLRARHEESETEEKEDNGIYFGDIMVEMSVILRQLYSQYNENYEEAQQTYRELSQTKEFQEFVHNKAKGTQTKLNQKSTDLLTLLYLPIQRMIMYDSFLKDIIALTPQDHPDYEDLCNALKMLISATKQADRVVEKRRNMEMVIKIQAQILGADIAEPHRRYVYDNDILLVVGKQHKERHMFLFNDCLLLTKLRKKKYEVEVHMKLANIKIVDVDNQNDRGTFKVVDSDNTEYCFLSDEKQSWLHLLDSTIKKLRSPPAELKSLRDEEEAAERDDEVRTKEVTREFLIEKILHWALLKPEEAHAELKEIAKTKLAHFKKAPT